ncbi:MAG TPA: bacillithiol biosynthesis deacetylase BshB1 [Acidobacteriota bacterium]|nr:bacillithiol biosynthesis deacetylase BshB1 [Acidobacteriota bacterium]
MSESDQATHPQVDVLAVGAHPDDVEINCGGTLLSLLSQGYRTAVADLTRGELASRGTPQQRNREAEQASSILGLTFRANLELPDGDIAVDADSRLKLIRLIRDARPGLVLTHSRFGHPDHGKTARLVEEAVHHAGLASLSTGQERHRPEKVAYWINYNQPLAPHFAVDVSDYYERKEEAIRAYRSQLGGHAGQPATYLSQPDFLQRLRSFHSHLGSQSGCRYAEGFLFSRLPRIADLTQA